MRRRSVIWGLFIAGISLSSLWLLSFSRFLHVHFPVSTGHFLSITFYDGLFNFDYLHCGVPILMRVDPPIAGDSRRILYAEALAGAEPYLSYPLRTRADFRRSGHTLWFNGKAMMWSQQKPGITLECEHLHAPAWALPALLFLLAGAGLIWRFLLIRSRRGQHRCILCGYSLTGNTSGVCPECGTPIRSPADVPPR